MTELTTAKATPSPQQPTRSSRPTPAVPSCERKHDFGLVSANRRLADGAAAVLVRAAVQRGLSNAAVGAVVSALEARKGLRRHDPPPPPSGDGVVVQRFGSTEMVAVYGVSDNIVLNDPDLKKVFETDQAKVLAVLDTNRATTIKELRLFLKAGDGAVQTRWNLLKELNQLLGLAVRKLATTSNTQYISTTDFQTLMVDLRAASQQTRALLATKGAETTLGKTLTNLRTQTNQFADLNALLLIVEGAGGVTTNAQLLSPDVRAKLTAVHNVHPPGSAKPTMVWGQGNSPIDTNDNIDQHARKHLLRLGTADNPDPDEPYKWMQRLGYTITRSYVEGALGSPTPTPIDTQIYDSSGVVQSQQQARIFFNQFLPTAPTVVQALLSSHKAAYADDVAAASASMTSATVTADGGRVQLVGQNGGLFIAAKWGGGTFTISSGYLNTTKLATNMPMKVWSLV